MKLRCKPRDLAYVTGPDMPAAWVGRVVQVVARSPESDAFWGGPSWLVRSTQPLPVTDERRRCLGYSTTATIGDAFLRPIGGVSVEAEEGAEVTA